jgi:hypothetical protein
VVSSDSAGGDPVTIEGGPDSLGNSYHWTVSNQSTSPIVGLEIPHYRTSLFFAPAGWTFNCTHLAGVGEPDRPGVCTAKADSPGQGIAPGRSAAFGLQLATGSVKRGVGDARVTFADSKTQIVSGVVIPVPEGIGDKYIPLIGLGTILLIFVLYQWVRGRKRYQT